MKKTKKALPIDDVADFDSYEVGKALVEETAILELHIGQPGFKKSIDAEHFMKVLAGLTEADMSGLSPQMKKQIDKFRQTGELADAAAGNGKPDPSLLHVSQDLIDRAAIAAIATHDKKFTNWIKRHALPSPIRFQGAYMMRMVQTDLIDKGVVDYIKGRTKLIKAFGARWNHVVDEAKTLRGPFFDSADYPSFDTVEPQYHVDFRWVNFDVPTQMAQRNKEIHKREAGKIRQFYADAAQEIRDAARISFQDLTENLLSKLGTDEAGKPKRFTGRSVEKVKEFIDVFLGGGDMTGDAQMVNIMVKCKEVLANVDPDEVRKQDDVRVTLAKAVEGIKAEASKMVVVSKRKFALAKPEAPETEG
jgi:hypothetical protein